MGKSQLIKNSYLLIKPYKESMLFNYMKVLTKSDYLIGLECPRFLWNKQHHPEKIRKSTIAEQFRFDDGLKVGIEAQKLFSEGIDLSKYNYKENIKKTKDALNENKPIFEAGFEFNNCFSRADILVPNEGGWDIIEVKAATKIKDINIHDISFQRYIYEGNGLKIKKCYILHLNKEYYRKGDLNIKELYKKEDVTKESYELLKNIEKSIKEVFAFLSLTSPPKSGFTIKSVIKEGHHDCKIENCLELPENHVFCLYRGGKLSCELYDNGIELIKDIPNTTKLNFKQSVQRECEKTGKVHINKEEIKKFFNKLEYPIYCLDFETFSTAIPLFYGTKAYSQIPFQYSLHVQEKEESKAKHYEFLYEGNSDPRKEFMDSLHKVLGEKGTIVVYNQSFEINRLKELGENFPEYKKWVESIPSRTVDLLVLFREFSYYNPKQQGSASIKKVLPALTGKTYNGMTISDGGSASVEFFNTHYTKAPKEKIKQVREDLLKYCGLDTEAEIMIIDRLKELIQG
jgi:hypothetical protein